MDINRLSEMVLNGDSTVEIAKEFQIGQTSVRYWLRKLGLKTKWKGYLANKQKFSDEFLLQVWGQSDSINQFLLKLGVGNSGGAWYHYRNRLKQAGINLDSVSGKINGRKRGGEITAKNANQKTILRQVRLCRLSLKKHMDLNKIPYICSECGLNSWREKKILLHIHHKDTDRGNNKIENLCYLCPNCHSLRHHILL